MKVRDLRKVLKGVGHLHGQRGDKAVRKGLDAFAVLLDGHDDESVRDYMAAVKRARKDNKASASAGTLRSSREK